MMRRLLNPSVWTPCSVILLLLVMTPQLSAAEPSGRKNTNCPPDAPAALASSVIDTIPDDIKVIGRCDIPVGDTIRFVNMTTMDTILVPPVDSTSSSGMIGGALDFCAGDTIWRIWRGTYPTDMAMVEEVQQIVVDPDTINPVSNFSIQLDTVVSCRDAQSVFPGWLSNRGLAITTNGYDCSGIEDIIPPTPPGTGFTFPSCDTLQMTWTLVDSCGNFSNITANFITVDDEAPILMNVPDTLTVGCDTVMQYLMNNPPSMVTVDDCEPGLTPTFVQDSLPVGSQCPDGREYDLRRTWTVSDSCGNSSQAVQLIRVRDQAPPSFTPPMDITISCDVDIDDLSILGDVTDTLDNCGGPISLFYNDVIIPVPDTCDNFFFVRRQWTAEDVCGNSLNIAQDITVRDTTPPSFLVPADTTVNCGEENNFAITGLPTLITDNCSNPADIETGVFSETIIAGSCENSYTIKRTWRAVDECGNDSLQVQQITVIDTIAPSFNQLANDRIISCMQGVNLEEEYESWVNFHGGAVASDLCTVDDDLEWSAIDVNTGMPVGSMPTYSCPAASDTLFMQTVDFIVDDGCGNADTTRAHFVIIDNISPKLQECPNDTVIGTNFGQCSANFTLDVPFIEEECAADFQQESVTASAFITSDAAPGQETATPVNDVVLSFAVSQPLPVNSIGNATLNLSLLSVDAEAPTEFFRVFGEDGTLIGRTGRSGVQCGNADTSLVVSETLIEAWAVDGVIDIRLEPNIPNTQPGSFAINGICSPQGQVVGELNFERANLVRLVYSYRVNQAPAVQVAPIAPVMVTLPIGMNSVTYYVEDCAGNVDSCSYQVLVEDQEPPQVSCPSDIVVQLDAGSCSSMVTLPLPDDVIDNCGLETPYQQQLPMDTASAWLTFTEDPNLNDFIANPKSYTFNNVAANALGTVNLTLRLRGDFNSTSAVANIVADGVDTLAATPLGVASCAAEGQYSVSISAADFNEWASDGSVTFTLEPVFIAVPPGGPGDGINPCDPVVVDTDNEVDSISYVFMELSYQQVSLSYYAEGATEIPFSQMSAPEFAPVHEFSLGDTDVSYVVADARNNLDTCSYQVSIVDVEPPVALCKATFVPINPSGLDVDTVLVSDFDDGSFDNCEIDTMYLFPNTFECDQAGSTVTATLTVVDIAGNVSTCQNMIRIEAEEPEPAFSPGICGGDTLYLFANPPPAEGGVVYSYTWFGPNGQLVSTDENPVIPNVDADDSGAYVVVVEGITGCLAEGVVNVTIIDQPLTASVVTEEQICADEDIVLTSSFTLTDATYYWYQGQAPNGTLIGTTDGPTLTIPALNNVTVTQRSYYLVIEANGCLSDPSAARTVQITPRPQAIPDDQTITVCEGESFSLGTAVSGSGISYQWVGPDGFSSTLQYPPTFDEAESENAGIYQLTVTRNGCSSLPASTVLFVNPRPDRPVLPNERKICESDTLKITTLPSGAASYTWTAPDLSTFTTATNQLVLPNANDEYDGSWTVVSQQFGCESQVSNTLNVTVNTRPEAFVMAEDQAVCERSTLNLTGAPQLQNASYRWTGPNGYQSFQLSPSVSNMNSDKAGTYTFRIRTEAGCEDTASIDINVIESVDILGVSNTAPSCLYGPTDISLQATVFPPDTGGYGYEWSGPGFSSDNAVAVIEDATGSVDGNEYSLIVYTPEGCPSLPAFTEVSTQNAPARLPAPTAANNPDAVYCVGDQIVLNTAEAASPNATYVWATPSPGQIATDEPTLTITDASLAEGGVYRVFVIVDGCASIISEPLNVTVNPNPSVTAFSNSPLCEGETLQLFANSGTGASFQWQGPVSSALQNPEIPNADSMLHSGTYQVEATLNGCTSQPALVEVVVNETPSTVTAIESNAPICLDDESPTLTLSAIGEADVFYWYLNGAPMDTTVSPDLLYSGLDTLGMESFSVFVEAAIGNCVADPSPSLTVELDTIPEEMAVAGVDTSICFGETIELYADSLEQSTGQWSVIGTGGISFSNPGSPNATVSGLQGDLAYQLQWSLSNGACRDFSQDTMIITVNTAEVAFAGMDTIFCPGDMVSLSANVPEEGMGMWSQSAVQEDFNVRIDSLANPNTGISGPGLLPGNTYVFIWTVDSECGQDSSQVFVSIADNNPDAGPDQVVCDPQAVTVLEAGQPADGVTGRWSSPDTELVFTDRTELNTNVANLAIGENIIVWTIDGGRCGAQSQDTMVIDYQRPPRAFDDEAETAFAEETMVAVLANDEVPQDANVFIIMEPNNGTARVVDGTMIAYTPNPNFVGEDMLVYEVCREGCECDEATLRILIGEEEVCDAPNIITPNGDGINDDFIIPCLLTPGSYPNSQLLVFNRWGDEVYRSPVPYPNDWDGTFDGQDLPVDTYFYVLKLGDGSKPQTGFILIQR